MVSFLDVLLWMYFIYIFITIIYLILDNKESPSTFSWIFIIILLPVIGLITYFLIGKSYKKELLKEKEKQKVLTHFLHKAIEPLIRAERKEVRELEKKEEFQYQKKLLELLHKNSGSLLTADNRVGIITSGETKFKLLIDDLNNAKKFIHLQYFIWRSDELGERIKEVLIKKARSGVEVRILYDSLGGIFLSRKYIRELRRAGVKIYPSESKGLLFKLRTLNHRNHIKIAVIDGNIAYTGGMNIAQEYIDGGKRFNYWRDTHLRIEGDASNMLQGIFSVFWYKTTIENLFLKRYYTDTKSIGKIPIQITASGIDTEWESIKQLYFTLINSAKKKVYIQSPYFVPDISVITALETAALSGMDVKFMMTGVPDKKIPYWAAHTYLERLLKAGVKIYKYKKGFMHSKTIVVDSEICSIGTTNLDLRSFNLNYEVNTLIYDRTVSKKLTEIFLNDLNDCEQFTLVDYNKISPIAKFRNSIARLFSPLL